ncbi:MAG: hypothetical protein HY900_04840 [Deltaproteobacteria bacterium]|nr:hypothetical protein [Deltaproteobacteria bacterium]
MKRPVRSAVPRILLGATLLGAPWLPFPSAAAEPAEAPPEAPATPETPGGSWSEPFYGAVSGQVDALSRRIDAFFGGERAYEESTRSTLRLGAGVEWRENREFRFVSKVRLKLDLPYSRERFNFLLESDLDEDLEEDGQLQVAEALQPQTQASNYNAAVRLAPKVPPGWKLTADAGVKLNWPPDPFARVRVRRTFALGDWILRGTQRVFWFTSRGLGETTTVELERAIWTEGLLRLTSEARWEEEEEGLSLLQAASLFQSLGPDYALVYTAAVRGVTSPSIRTSQYEASIGFRGRLIRPWLFYEIQPTSVWPRTDNFRPAGSIFFRLEALFGADYRC